MVGDIGTKRVADELSKAARARFDGLDVLVNAAGIFRPTPFLEHTEEDFDAYVSTILKGTFFATKAAVPLLEARGGGAIVNVGSMWAL